MIRMAPLTALAASLLLTACGGDSSTDTTESRELELDFRALNTTVTPTADMTADICSATLTAAGSTGVDARIAYMAFYVSEVSLLTASGKKVPVTLDDNRVTQEQGVALVDFRNKAADCTGDAKVVDNMVRGSYTHQDGDDYTGVEFQLGLPTKINHGDPSLSTAGILSKNVDMHWNWLGGYRYLRMDVVPEGRVTKPDNSSVSNWNVHLGATGCSNADVNDGTSIKTDAPSAPCANPNTSVVSLEGFTPENNQIGVDIAALYRGSNLSVDMCSSVGCMSGTADPECAEVFARLGLAHPTQGDGFGTEIKQVVFSSLND